MGESDPVKCFSDADLDTSFGYEPDPVVAGRSSTSSSRSTGSIADQCGAKYGDHAAATSPPSRPPATWTRSGPRSATSKLNYLGYSYGTLLGAVYAQLFPNKIRAMVLDGAVDPTQTTVAAVRGPGEGLRARFDNFATWCTAHPAQCPIAPDVRGRRDHSARQRPHAPRSCTPTAARPPPAGSSPRCVAAMYSESSWPLLAQAIATCPRATPRLIFALADSYAERRRQGHVHQPVRRLHR